MFLLYKLADLLPARLQPIAKATVPAVVTLLAVAYQAADTGLLDTAALTTALVGVFTTALTFAIPNKTRQ